MIALADHASRLLGSISSPVLIAVTAALVIAVAVKSSAATAAERPAPDDAGWSARRSVKR